MTGYQSVLAIVVNVESMYPCIHVESLGLFWMSYKDRLLLKPMKAALPNSSFLNMIYAIKKNHSDILTKQSVLVVLIIHRNLFHRCHVQIALSMLG